MAFDRRHYKIARWPQWEACANIWQKAKTESSGEMFHHSFNRTFVGRNYSPNLLIRSVEISQLWLVVYQKTKGTL